MQWLSILLTAVILPPLTLLASLFLAQRNLHSLYRSNSTETNLILAQSPQSISTLHVISTFLQIISKYIPTLWTRPPPLIPHANGKDFDLPLIRIQGPLRLNPKDEAAFQHAVSIANSTPDSDTEGTLNLLFLPCLTSPVLPLLLAQKACPIRPLGSVNTRTTFTILRPDLVRNASSLRSTDLSFTATFGGPSQPGYRRKRGVEFCIEIDVLAADGQVLVRQQFWSLMFLARSVRPVFNPATQDSAAGTASAKLSNLKLSQASTKSALEMTPAQPPRWAACCKDYNPIHVSGIGARVFGFSSVIAHGNHAVALAIELARRSATATGKEGDEHNKAKELLWKEKRAVEIEVKFMRPMMLPVRAQVGWIESDGESGVGFVIGKMDREFTAGTCRVVNA